MSQAVHPTQATFDRLHPIVLIVSIVLLSWLGMMVVHEFGHVSVAWAAGGRVTKVVLNPLEFSRTDVFPNPHPLAETWGGPVIGVLLPLAAWGVARLARWSGAYLLRFFAGLCLVANGAYIGVGSIHRVGDTYGMLLFGSSIWQLWLFGAISFAMGLLLWHGLGADFGIGPKAKPVSRVAACGILALLVFVILAELLLGGR